MSSFLYYVPGETIAGKADFERVIAEAGLADRLSGAGFEKIQVMRNGPDGGSGVMVRAYDKDTGCPRFGYHKDEQDWYCIDDGVYWIGVNRDAMPCPDDLVRRDAVTSHSMRLNDGAEWQVPLALYIPKTLRLGATGESIEQVDARYVRLGELATEAAEAIQTVFNGIKEGFEDGVSIELDLDMLENLAHEGLNACYRMGIKEARILGLFTNESGPYSLLRYAMEVGGLSFVQGANAEGEKKNTEAT